MWRAVLIGALLSFGGANVNASEISENNTAPSSVVGGVIVLDSEALFSNTKFGKQVSQKLQTQADALRAEFREIEGALMREEQELTAQRETMSLETFRELAEAFDEKVQNTRKAQLERANRMNAQFEAQRALFFDTITPILKEFMHETGAQVLIERSETILVTPQTDVTQVVIDLIDNRFGAEMPRGVVNE